MNRPGWRAGPLGRGYYGASSCPNCVHPYAQHFWWYSETESDRNGIATQEFGCHDCSQYICTNVKAVAHMSSVNLCERCGAFMLAKALGAMDLQKRPGDAYERMELCPACIGDLVAFLAEKPVRDRQAFSEPWQPPDERSETMQMLEAGPCGAQKQIDGVDFMCLRPKGHKGYHIDGNTEWVE